MSAKGGGPGRLRSGMLVKVFGELFEVGPEVPRELVEKAWSLEDEVERLRAERDEAQESEAAARRMWGNDLQEWRDTNTALRARLAATEGLLREAQGRLGAISAHDLIKRIDAHLAGTGGEVSLQEPLTFRRLQDEQRPWVLHNFAGREPFYPLLGAMEELGELSHAHLKKLQGIRTGEDHDAAKKDAVADIVIFLADYCTANEIDFQDAVEETWEKVKRRDWKADKILGVATSTEPCGTCGGRGEVPRHGPGAATFRKPCPDCAGGEEE